MLKIISIVIAFTLSACSNSVSNTNTKLSMTQLNDTECKISDGRAVITIKCTNDLNTKIDEYNKSNHTASMNLESLVATLLLGKK